MYFLYLHAGTYVRLPDLLWDMQMNGYLKKIGYNPDKIPKVPLSGWTGDNLFESVCSLCALDIITSMTPHAHKHTCMHKYTSKYPHLHVVYALACPAHEIHQYPMHSFDFALEAGAGLGILVMFQPMAY